MLENQIHDSRTKYKIRELNIRSKNQIQDSRTKYKIQEPNTRLENQYKINFSTSLINYSLR